MKENFEKAFNALQEIVAIAGPDVTKQEFNPDYMHAYDIAMNTINEIMGTNDLKLKNGKN